MTIRQGNGDSSFAHFNLAADFHVVAAAQFNKVAHVGFQMKADEVGIEKPAQHLIAPRKLPVDFRRWEWDMQEEPDGEIRAQLTQDSRDKLQLRSEEHTSELQSRGHLVCRLLLEKKKYKKHAETST